MAELKKCPYCGEEIQASAKKCRYCGEWLSDTGSPAQSVTGNPVDVRQPTTPVQEEPQSGLEIRYDGESSSGSFFQQYFVDPYIRKYADFKGYTSRKTFWMAYLTNCIISLGVAGLVLLLSAVGGTSGIVVGIVLMSIFSLGLAVPQLALCCRRLHDAGKSPYSIFLGLIPVVGSIILLIYFCQPTSYYDPETEKQIEGHDEPPVKFSPADWGILGGCIALFIAGIILLTSSISTLLGGYDSTSGYDLGDYYDASDEYVYVEDGEDEVVVVEEQSSYNTIDFIKANTTRTTYKGEAAYTWKGYFQKGNNKYPVELTYIDSQGNFLYKNIRYNVEIVMDYLLDEEGEGITIFSPKDDFQIDLEPFDGELFGTATQGNSILDVRLSPV